MILIHKDGRERHRTTFGYYAGKKYGWLEYWPEILDDLRDGFHKKK
jgi:hypothetical protein